MISPATYFTRHAQALIAALGRLLRRPLGSLLTVLAIAIALSLPAALWVLVKNARAAAGDVAGSIELSVYLRTGTALEKAEQLAAAARERSDVQTVTVIPADAALAEFREYSGFGAALDALQGNPLPHVITLKPATVAANPRSIESLRKYLAAWPEVENVQVDGEWVRRLVAILDLLRDLLAAFSALLALGVLVVIGNAIRLEIGARRAEIEVTKLVGGSDAFVRRPFLYEGFFFGLLGGLAAMGLTAALIAVLGEPVARLAALYGSRLTLAGLDFAETAALVGAAALLGTLGAWIGAARLISRIEPRD
ncbi:MAG: permease-like cell division protein FtsX [Gammaproteobacteria bacterium]|nr:permease-like cell division protein FtsX [Gammaproteobacteria bacterium]